MGLQDEFAQRGVLRGGTLVLPALDAREMVERARDRGVGVLGVDGFWITETTTRPDLGHSLDLGSGEGRWDEAVQFIEQRAESGLMFEVVVDE